MLTSQIQRDIILDLNSYIAKKYYPHLLFHGAPGVGKTTLARNFAAEVLGGKLSKLRYLEINASDQRGIDAMRDIVIAFAKTPSFKGLKVILLDEVDYLTNEAQAVLRQPMLLYRTQCLFILTCNHLHKVHPAIQSRCAKFEFKPLVRSDMRIVLTKLMTKHKIALSTTRQNELIELAQGDIRYLENNLLGTNTKPYCTFTFANLLTLPPLQLLKAIETMLNAATCTFLFKTYLQQIILYSITERQKAEYILHLAEADCMIANGATPVIQLTALVEKCKKLQ